MKYYDCNNKELKIGQKVRFCVYEGYRNITGEGVITDISKYMQITVMAKPRQTYFCGFARGVSDLYNCSLRWNGERCIAEFRDQEIFRFDEYTKRNEFVEILGEES